MDAPGMSYSEEQQQLLMSGYPEGHPLAERAEKPRDKKKRRAKGKAQRQARKKNR
jgi:hypothetical protein